jgi:hypothetical protein
MEIGEDLTLRLPSPIHPQLFEVQANSLNSRTWPTR